MRSFPYISAAITVGIASGAIALVSQPSISSFATAPSVLVILGFFCWLMLYWHRGGSLGIAQLVVRSLFYLAKSVWCLAFALDWAIISYRIKWNDLIVSPTNEQTDSRGKEK